MKINVDKWGLAALAVVLAVLPFTASGYVLYIANLLLIFIVLCAGPAHRHRRDRPVRDGPCRLLRHRHLYGRAHQ